MTAWPHVTDPSSEEFRRLAEHSIDLISLHGPDATFRYTSPVVRELLGYEPSELVGTSPYDLLHPDDLEAVARGYAAMDERPARAEYRVRRKDGSWTWFETTARAIRDGDGGARSVQCHSRDVSHRKLAEQARAGTEEQLRTIQANSPIGLALVDLDGELLEVNPALCRMLQRSQTELLSMTFQELTHPDDVDVDLLLLAETLAGSRSGYDLDKRYLRPDGSEVWAQLHVALVRDDAGEPQYFVSQVVDVTDRVLANRQLRHQRAELEHSREALAAALAQHDEILATATHELRSPLTILKGTASLLASDVGAIDDATRNRLLSRLTRHTDRMEQLVSDLLDLAGSRNAEPELHVTPVGLPRLVAQAVEDTPLPAGLLAVDVPRVKIRTDQGRLRRVLVNLLSNANKYGRPPIEVTAEIDDDHVRITVRDHGDGVAPDFVPHLFAPFSRSDGVPAGTAGTGLGLAIVDRLVHDVGGSIVHAAPAGGGAAFVVTIPLALPATP